MPLPENAAAIEAVLAVLKPRILGQEREAWSCCCGAVRGAAATAVEVKPAGNHHPGQETEWYLWTVRMQPKPGQPDRPWSCGLSQFIQTAELEELFGQHFVTANRK